MTKKISDVRSINLLIFHARDLSGLTVYLCGNPWNPHMRFPRNFQCKKTGWDNRVDCFQVWKSWKPLVRFPPSFQCRVHGWNRRVDCLQVQKPSWNHIGLETTGKLLMSRFLVASSRFPFLGNRFFTQCRKKIRY